MHNNYGDVALNLPADWSRSRNAGDPTFVLTTVGHENGIADAYLKEHPRQLHQFIWVSGDDKNQMSILRSRKYEPCEKGKWIKNPALWEWDGEGHIVHNGQILMAREASHYEADQSELDERIKHRDAKSGVTTEEENAMRKLQLQGAIIEDDQGRPLKPIR